MTGWRISYPGVNLEFGGPESGFLFETAPRVDDPGRTVGDVPLPSSDGLLMGRDFTAGSGVSFSIGVVGADAATVRARAAELQRVWRGDVIRQSPGATAMLTSDHGRVTFGRPRRFQMLRDEERAGFVAVECDFQTTTDLWFGPETAANVRVAPSVGEGMYAPFVAPFVFLGEADAAIPVNIAGTMPTYGVYTITGPITDPVVELQGQWRLEFSITLAAGQQMVVDTRPWVSTITRNGASVAGALRPSAARLKDTKLPPGSHVLRLRGTTITTATMSARWRTAYATP